MAVNGHSFAPWITALRRSLSQTQRHHTRAYRAWRRRFVHRRLKFSVRLAAIAYGTFILYTISGIGAGLPDQEPGWLEMAIATEVGLLISLGLLNGSWGRRHPQILLVAVSWIITLFEQIWATLNGFALPGIYAWTLTFLVQAAIIPVQWPLHLLTQVSAGGYYFLVNSIVGLDVPPGLAQDLRQWLYLLWFCAICNISVYLYEQLQQSEFQAHQDLKRERDRSERLLLNILPAAVAKRLKHDQQTIAESFAEASVLFADVVGFTQLSAGIPPKELVNLLNQIFSKFDRLAAQHGLEKIKTIGDSYMVVGGLPVERDDHLEAIARMALDMQKAIAHFQVDDGQPMQIRIGINVGPVVAGVIGMKKFIYDLWGDTVNVASRMESQGVPGRIQVTESVYEQLCDRFEFERRGTISIKGKGEMVTYLLVGHRADRLPCRPAIAPATTPNSDTP